MSKREVYSWNGDAPNVCLCGWKTTTPAVQDTKDEILAEHCLCKGRVNLMRKDHTLQIDAGLVEDDSPGTIGAIILIKGYVISIPPIKNIIMN